MSAAVHRHAPFLEQPPAGGLLQRLRSAGLQPTLQRMAIATVLLPQPVHMTAEQVLRAVQEHLPDISRATVYGTLQAFARGGLLRELAIGGQATVYDSNTAPHHHLYHVDTGEVHDLPAEHVQVSGLPALAGGLELAGVDVIVRVRSAAAPAAG